MRAKKSAKKEMVLVQSMGPWVDVFIHAGGYETVLRFSPEVATELALRLLDEAGAAARCLPSAKAKKAIYNERIFHTKPISRATLKKRYAVPRKKP